MELSSSGPTLFLTLLWRVYGGAMRVKFFRLEQGQTFFEDTKDEYQKATFFY